MSSWRAPSPDRAPNLASVKLSNFWTEDFPRPADLPVGGLPDEVDVAVVGSGITGLVAALRLARSGASVAVLEAERIGHGASTRNGGMTIYGLKADTADVMKRFGPERGMAMWQASQDAIDLVEKVVRDEGIDCHFRRDGSACLGFTERDLANFRAEREWMADRLGFASQVYGPERIGEVVGGGHFHAALVEDFSGGLHPARYTYGLAAAAAGTGATLVEHARVLGWTGDGDGHVVRTALGSVRAADVLVATNGYTGPLHPWLRRRIVPIGSYIAVTAPLPADRGEELIPAGRMLWTARRFLNYFRLTPDGRLLMGGRQNLRTDLDLADSGAVLRRRIVEFFPQLADVEITHSWTGTLGVTFDLLPHVGRVDGAWYAMGYSGHGVATATLLGADAARHITGEATTTAFSGIPHPTMFFYRKRPWFLPAAARWYRLLDHLGR